MPLVADVLGEMGIEARAVLMLRAPADIARSVASRDGTTTAYAHLLWLRHMIDAERATRVMPRAILAYDAMLEDWRGAMAALAPLAGRAGWRADAAEAAEIGAFLDPGLRHHRAEAPAPLEEPLAGIVAAVAAGLDALVVADGDAERARLDEAYALLDAAPWLEGDIIHDELRHRRMPAAEDVAESEPAAAPDPVPPPAPEPSADADLIRASGLLDADWYRATYSEAAASGLDPVDHYVRIGAALGYNPHPLFDTGYYARQMARRIG